MGPSGWLCDGELGFDDATPKAVPHEVALSVLSMIRSGEVPKGGFSYPHHRTKMQANYAYEKAVASAKQYAGFSLFQIKAALVKYHTSNKLPAPFDTSAQKVALKMHVYRKAQMTQPFRKMPHDDSYNTECFSLLDLTTERDLWTAFAKSLSERNGLRVGEESMFNWNPCVKFCGGHGIRVLVEFSKGDQEGVGVWRGYTHVQGCGFQVGESPSTNTNNGRLRCAPCIAMLYAHACGGTDVLHLNSKFGEYSTLLGCSAVFRPLHSHNIELHTAGRAVVPATIASFEKKIIARVNADRTARGVPAHAMHMVGTHGG